MQAETHHTGLTLSPLLAALPSPICLTWRIMLRLIICLLIAAAVLPFFIRGPNLFAAAVLPFTAAACALRRVCPSPQRGCMLGLEA